MCTVVLVLLVMRSGWATTWPRATDPKPRDSSSNKESAQEALARPAAPRNTANNRLCRSMVSLFPAAKFAPVATRDVERHESTELWAPKRLGSNSTKLNQVPHSFSAQLSNAS